MYVCVGGGGGGGGGGGTLQCHSSLAGCGRNKKCERIDTVLHTHIKQCYFAGTKAINRMIAQSRWTYGVIITLLLRQNDAAASFGRIMTLSSRHVSNTSA